MKVAASIIVLFASQASAFVVPQFQRGAGVAFTSRPLFMSDEATPSPPTEAPPATATPKKEVGGALVPIKEETVEFTAGLLGGAAGFAIGGPVLGFITAAAANYVSKIDGDATEVVQAISKSSLQVFNYLANLDSKYEILTKAKTSLQESLENLKKRETVDPETITKVENAIANTNAKIKEINDEYDLVGGGMTALGVVGDLVEKAVVKAGELNEEYKLSERAKTALKNAIDKAKDATGRS